MCDFISQIPSQTKQLQTTSEEFCLPFTPPFFQHFAIANLRYIYVPYKNDILSCLAG